MRWRRIDRYVQKSDDGYRVTAYGGATWTFAAWAPKQSPELSEREWAARHLKQHYAVGEAVPMRTPCLGHTDTADAARALCEAHAATSAKVSTS